MRPYSPPDEPPARGHAAYAAGRRALISTSVLGDASRREPDVRARIGEMHGADTSAGSTWPPIRCTARCQPCRPPHPLGRPTRIEAGSLRLR